MRNFTRRLCQMAGCQAAVLQKRQPCGYLLYGIIRCGEINAAASVYWYRFLASGSGHFPAADGCCYGFWFNSIGVYTFEWTK